MELECGQSLVISHLPIKFQGLFDTDTLTRNPLARILPNAVYKTMASVNYR